MNLTKNLAAGQLKVAKKRTILTLLGIALSVATLTAVNGFVASVFDYMDSQARPIHLDERLGFLVIALILGGIIAVASIIVISNAFRVSAAERTQQFGILKSVGATKRQIRSIIMYEALYLGIIGIPIGLAAGLVVNFSVLNIISRLIQPIASIESFTFRFVISPWALILAILAAFGVVLLSALLPAEKAARLPAISSINRVDDIKMKKIRTLGISRLLFGTEGNLAAKQMKRSRRSYRATVLSLSISIILLLAAASLRTNLLTQWNIMHYDGVDANVVFNARRSAGDIPPELIRDMTARMEEFPGAVVRGYSHMLFTAYINGESTNVRIMSVAPELYSHIINEAGVPYGSNVILNVRNETDVLGITRQTHPFGHLVGQSLSISPATSIGYWGHRDAEETPPDIHIHGQINHVPEDILFSAFMEISIIVPEFPIGSYYWFIQTDQADAFVTLAFQVHEEFIHGSETLNNMSTWIGSLDERNAEIHALTSVISLLIYGFATMLTLISVTNVISTISTNTRLRAREFAVLTSIGMTQGGIKRMLALESLISSVRALLFGLPLGMLAAWGIYLGTQMDRVRFGFIFPWEMVLYCMAGVFVITFITTRFAAAKMRKESVVETIRPLI